MPTFGHETKAEIRFDLPSAGSARPVLLIEIGDEFLELSLEDAAKLREYLNNPPAPAEPTDDEIVRAADKIAMLAGEALSGSGDVVVYAPGRAASSITGNGYFVEARIFVPRSALDANKAGWR